MSDHPPFTCPRCERTSHNENDARAGYCGACYEVTDPPTWWRGQRWWLRGEEVHCYDPDAELWVRWPRALIELDHFDLFVRLLEARARLTL